MPRHRTPVTLPQLVPSPSRTRKQSTPPAAASTTDQPPAQDADLSGSGGISSSDDVAANNGEPPHSHAHFPSLSDLSGGGGGQSPFTAALGPDAAAAVKAKRGARHRHSVAQPLLGGARLAFPTAATSASLSATATQRRNSAVRLPPLDPRLLAPSSSNVNDDDDDVGARQREQISQLYRDTARALQNSHATRQSQSLQAFCETQLYAHQLSAYFWQRRVETCFAVSSSQASGHGSLAPRGERLEIPVLYGAIPSSSAEYCRFMATMQHTESHAHVDLCVRVLTAAADLCRDYDVPVAFLDSNRVDDLARHPDVRRLIKAGHVVHTFTAPDEIITIMAVCGQRYRGPNATSIAALKLQSTWRMYLTRSAYLQLRPYIRAQRIIEKQWRRKRDGVQRLVELRHTVHQMRIEHAETLRRQLISKWSQTTTQPHTAIVLVDGDTTSPSAISAVHLILAAGKNLSSSATDIVVVATEPQRESSIHQLDQDTKSISFVSPENKRFLPAGSRTSVALAASFKAVKKLRGMSARPCYLLTAGQPCDSDYIVSSLANIPLLGPAYSALACSTPPNVAVTVQCSTLIQFQEGLVEYMLTRPDTQKWFWHCIDQRGRNVRGSFAVSDTLKQQIIAGASIADLSDEFSRAITCMGGVAELAAFVRRLEHQINAPAIMFACELGCDEHGSKVGDRAALCCGRLIYYHFCGDGSNNTAGMRLVGSNDVHLAADMQCLYSRFPASAPPLDTDHDHHHHHRRVQSIVNDAYGKGGHFGYLSVLGVHVNGKLIIRGVLLGKTTEAIMCDAMCRETGLQFNADAGKYERHTSQRVNLTIAKDLPFVYKNFAYRPDIVQERVALWGSAQRHPNAALSDADVLATTAKAYGLHYDHESGVGCKLSVPVTTPDGFSMLAVAADDASLRQEYTVGVLRTYLMLASSSVDTGNAKEMLELVTQQGTYDSMTATADLTSIIMSRMANTPYKAVITRFAESWQQELEQSEVAIIDDDDLPDDQEFVNPSAHLRINSLHHIQDPLRRKQLFVSTFIAEEMLDIVWEGVGAAIEQQCTLEAQEQLREERERMKAIADAQQEAARQRELEGRWQNTGDFSGSAEEFSDEDDGDGSEYDYIDGNDNNNDADDEKDKSMHFLQGNSAVKTLRKMFQNVHTFRGASSSKSGSH